METISIICLIYQSPHYAEFVYQSIKEFTPELETGEARFYFIANDPTDEVVSFLRYRGFPYFIKRNPHYSESERFEMGYAYHEYNGRVYMGYNYGIEISEDPIVVWINSDNYFSPGWLGNLKKRLTKETIVSPRIIQPTWFKNPLNEKYCEIMDFGTGLRSFNKTGFLQAVEKIKTDTASEGCAFFPAMCYKENIEKVGYFPEGNLHGGDYNIINETGDTCFYRKLSEVGVKHIQSDDSIIYHFNEGEKYLK